MKLTLFILITILMMEVNSIRLVLFVSRDEGPTCFYHYLNNGEKYSLSTKSINIQRYKVQIFVQEDHQWKSIHKKMVQYAVQTVSKMSHQQATYMFCFSNDQPEILKIGVQFMSGLELGEGHALPSLDDKNLLDQQIAWMQKEKQRLIQSLQRMQGSQAAQNLRSSSGKMLLILAILGVLSVLAINYFFFRLAKKTLKDRKLI